jgi:hypothetical protein
VNDARAGLPDTIRIGATPSGTQERQAKTMTVKREQRKIERTAEEQARLDAIREKYQQEKTGPDQVAASGEYEGPMQAGAYWEMRRLVAQLKAERERQGLSLAQLAERFGIDKGAISKL